MTLILPGQQASTRRWAALALAMLACATPCRAQSSTFKLSSFALPCSLQPNPFGLISRPTGVTLGDFNGDKKSDLALMCNSASSPEVLDLFLFAGKNDGAFQPVVQAPRPPNATYCRNPIAAGDLNGDGRTDVIAGGCTFPAPGERVVLSLITIFGTSTGFGVPQVANVPDQIIPLRIVDLNRDQLPDLFAAVVSSNSLTTLVVMLAQKTGGFAPATHINQFSPSSLLSVPAIADFNRDGILDIAVSLPTFTYIQLGNGDGTFKDPIELDFGNSVVATDFNEDGKIDLVIGDDTARALALLPGDGKGGFGTPVRIPGFTMPLAAVDLNGDDLADIVDVETNRMPILNANGQGSFQSVGSLFDLTPNYFLTSDLNTDGKPDAVAIDPDNLAHVALNTSSSQFVSRIRNGASFAVGQAVAPGSLASIFGGEFAPSGTFAQAASIPLPTELAGVSVTMNGISAPLLFVGQKQINAQVPWGLPSSGSVKVVVKANGVTYPEFSLTLASTGPGIFALSSGQAIAINPDGSLAAPSGSIPGIATRPARAGDPLILLGTGLGAVAPSISDGAAASDTLREALTKPTVLIGGISVDVPFAGLSPEFVGVNQVNVTVPAVNAPGVVLIQITSAGVPAGSQPTIAIVNQ